MNIAHHSDFGQNIRYQFDWLPDDPDAQVSVALDRMAKLIREDVGDPLIQGRAASALAAGLGNPIGGVWATVKPLIRFQQDVDIAGRLQVNDPRIKDVVEVFIRPVDQELLIRSQGQGVEDCDGFVLYGAALLTALGIRCNFVTVAADTKEPRRFSHVYLAAYPDGQRVPLDFSHGPYPGWECKNLGRKREWPIEKPMLEPCWIAAGFMALLAYFLIRGAA